MINKSQSSATNNMKLQWFLLFFDPIGFISVLNNLHYLLRHVSSTCWKKLKFLVKPCPFWLEDYLAFFFQIQFALLVCRVGYFPQSIILHLKLKFYSISNWKLLYSGLCFCFWCYSCSVFLVPYFSTLFMVIYMIPLAGQFTSMDWHPLAE